MSIILTVFEVVAPVFILAAIGFGWVKAGFEYKIDFVTRLAMTFSLPCLIFTALMNTEIDPTLLGATVWASVIAYIGVTAVMLLLVHVFRLNQQTFWAPLIFGNTGNLGLPLALFAFGAEGLGYAVIIFAVMGIYSFTIGIWMVAGSGNFTRALKEPLVGATVLGAIFLAMDWETPLWLTNALDLIGQMAIPLMLLTLGVALARLKPKAIWRGIVLSILKVAACAAIAIFAAGYMELPAVPTAVLVVQVSTPVAVTSYLLAQKYGAEAEEVAGLVVISTLLSVLYLPLILGFVM